MYSSSFKIQSICNLNSIFYLHIFIYWREIILKVIFSNANSKWIETWLTYSDICLDNSIPFFIIFQPSHNIWEAEIDIFKISLNPGWIIIELWWKRKILKNIENLSRLFIQTVQKSSVQLNISGSQKNTLQTIVWN